MDFEAYSRKMAFKWSQLDAREDRLEELLGYASRLDVQGLPVIYDQEHLSLLLGIDWQYLLSVSNAPQLHYIKYLVPKKRGGMREIHEPLPDLKRIQEWILHNILYRVRTEKVSKTAKAFVPGTGIRENVRLHTKKDLVVNLDLKDFFGSVKYNMVEEVFSRLGYAEAVSVMLANLCCCGGCLPQGAPTSPMLSNFVFKKYDDAIFGYCLPRKIMYTRYADDLTFSGNFDPGKIIGMTRSELKGTPFVINGKKTKVYGYGSRQLVTGIVVNCKPQLPREQRKRIRQEVHFLQTRGLESHLQHIGYTRTPVDYLRHILGRVNYALCINPKDEEMKRCKTFLHELWKRTFKRLLCNCPITPIS